MSPEHRKNISESNKGKVPWNKGKKCDRRTPETVEKIRQTMLTKDFSFLVGRVFTPEHRENIGNALRGKKRSKEAIEKTRLANLGSKRPQLTGKNNPMFTHPNAYKSKFGKVGVRQDIGFFVRSAWEANIIRIFRYMGLTIQYEPKCFSLSDGRTYCPDLFILETGEIVEIKGRWNRGAKEKVEKFQQEYPGISFDLIDPPVYNQYIKEFSNMGLNLEN